MPTRTDDATRQRVVVLRDELIADGLDAGAGSILDRLRTEITMPPSRATIQRILADAERITVQPHKRPRSSWTRFEAALPNETWQSDKTHWHLEDDTGVEFITWLDDHFHMIMHISAHPVANAPIVVDTFTLAAETHGLPASTLTDNGRIFTARFAPGTSGLGQFEQLIHDLGIRQKNGHPDRPHRAIARRTPAAVHANTPPAMPSIDIAGRHYPIRFDHIDASGVITIRHAGRLRHLGIGRAHKHRPVMVLISGPDTLTIDRDTGEILAEHTIDPDKDYQPRKH